jgi:two-component system alkaline phosphatase synthesis response regulator PhoP
MRKIYLVEDDPSIREVVTYALGSAGYEVEGFDNGDDLVAAMCKDVPHLILLDIMLPGVDGLTILKRLRNNPRLNKIPIIMLTAKSGEIDKVKGLDMGADDYITKPFSVLELISRVNAALRRAAPESEPEEVLVYKELTIDAARRAVDVGGENVVLTFKEYELLCYFMVNKEKALARDKIMEEIWDSGFEGESRTLDMHIHSLRQKLGSAGEYIKTVRNVGYKFSV